MKVFSSALVTDNRCRLQPADLTGLWDQKLTYPSARTSLKSSCESASSLASQWKWTKWTLIVFLGLELDSVEQQIRLPLDKLETILKELGEYGSSRTKQPSVNCFH